MNIFKLITDAVKLVGKVTKSDTPEIGKTIEKAGKLLTGTGGAINVITLSSIFGAGYSINDFINHWEKAPVPTAVIAVVLIAVNIVPSIIGMKYKAIGKSQTTNNPDNE